MFLAAAALLVLVTVPLFGGSLRQLATLTLHGSWLLWVALGTQVVITEVPDAGSRGLLAALHLLSYAAAGVFLWLNRRIPGLWLLTSGAGLNAVTIAVNGGTLPASASALRSAGIHPSAGFDNSGVLAHPHLAWLGDTMTTPAWLPLRNVLSVGDLVIVAGLIVLVHAVCLTRPWRSAAAAMATRRRRPIGAHRAGRPTADTGPSAVEAPASIVAAPAAAVTAPAAMVAAPATAPATPGRVAGPGPAPATSDDIGRLNPAHA